MQNKYCTNENEEECKAFFIKNWVKSTFKLSNFISNIIFASLFSNSSILIYSFDFF